MHASQAKASDATRAQSSTHLESTTDKRVTQDKAFRTLGYDAQKAALTPPDAAGPTQGRAGQDTDPFPALLAAAAENPQTGCTDAFITALTDRAGVLTPAQSAQLERVVAGVGRDNKLAIIAAIGTAEVDGVSFTRNLGQEDYPRRALGLLPGQVVVSEPTLSTRALPEDKHVFSGKITIKQMFTDRELDLVFTQLIRLPTAARKDPDVFATLTRNNVGSSYYDKDADKVVIQAERGYINKAGENWDAARQREAKDAWFEQQADKAWREDKKIAADAELTEAQAAELAKAKAARPAADHKDWQTRRAHDLWEREKPAEVERDKSGALTDKAAKARATYTTTWIAARATEATKLETDRKTMTTNQARYATMNAAQKKTHDDLVKSVAQRTRMAADLKVLETFQIRDWKEAQLDADQKATMQTDVAAEVGKPLTADQKLARGNAAAADGQRMFGKAVRHEIGHSFDFRDHPGDAMTWHADNGWTVYRDVTALEAAVSLWKGAPESPDQDKNIAAGKAVLAALFAKGTGGQLAAKIAEQVEAGAPADFEAWFKASEAYKIVDKAPQPNAWRNRHKVGGGMVAHYPVEGFFMQSSAALTGKLESWGNDSAPFSPREWAAECYAAWYDIEKPGDAPGRPEKTDNLTDGARTWLATVHAPGERNR